MIYYNVYMIYYNVYMIIITNIYKFTTLFSIIYLNTMKIII